MDTLDEYKNELLLGVVAVVVAVVAVCNEKMLVKHNSVFAYGFVATYGSEYIVVEPTLEANCVQTTRSVAYCSRVAYQGTGDSSVGLLLRYFVPLPFGRSTFHCWLCFRSSAGAAMLPLDEAPEA